MERPLVYCVVLNFVLDVLFSVISYYEVINLCFI